MAKEHPEFASIGGNTGKTNSFAGVDPKDLTGGVYDLASLFEGNGLLCFALELTIQETPDLVSNLFMDIEGAVEKITSTFGNASDSLGCPKVSSGSKKQYEKFPGYTKKYKGYKPHGSWHL